MTEYKPRKITPEIHNAIMELSHQGKTVRESSIMLQDKFGISISKATVANVINKAIHPTIQRKVRQIISKEMLIQEVVVSNNAITNEVVSKYQSKINTVMDNHITQVLILNKQLKLIDSYLYKQLKIIKSEKTRKSKPHKVDGVDIMEDSNIIKANLKVIEVTAVLQALEKANKIRMQTVKMLGK